MNTSVRKVKLKTYFEAHDEERAETLTKDEERRETVSK